MAEPEKRDHKSHKGLITAIVVIAIVVIAALIWGAAETTGEGLMNQEAGIEDTQYEEPALEQDQQFGEEPMETQEEIGVAGEASPDATATPEEPPAGDQNL